VREDRHARAGAGCFLGRPPRQQARTTATARTVARGGAAVLSGRRTMGESCCFAGGGQGAAQALSRARKTEGESSVGESSEARRAVDGASGSAPPARPAVGHKQQGSPRHARLGLCSRPSRRRLRP